jgi:hypothetical protein
MRKRLIVVVLLAAAAGLALVLFGTEYQQWYGWSVFAGVPFVIGFVSAALTPPDLSRLAGVTLALVSAGLVAILLLVLGREGVFCIGLAALLGLLPLGLGAIAGAWVRRGALVVFLGALTLAMLEPSLHTAKPRVYLVEDSLLVHASAAETWRTVIDLGEVKPSGDWVFRTGMACPVRTKISGRTRVCTMSTGLLLERIDVWQPGRRLGWVALSTPPPLKETNPFADVDPPHLHGMYRNVRGEFALEPLGPHATRLTRRTWYEYDMEPAAYWRLWCDFGASRIHRFVLEEVKRAAEGGARI